MGKKFNLPEDVHSISLKFLDLRGRSRVIRVPREMFDIVIEDGLSFDSFNIGFSDVSESDMVAAPDPRSYRVISYGQEKIAVFMCEIYWPDGSRFEGDPRYLLKNTIEELNKKDVTIKVKPEYEFHLLDIDTLEPLDEGRYIDGRPEFSSIISQLTKVMRDYDIPVEKIHHEGGAGQYEIEPLPYDDPIKAADDFILIKELVKEVAWEYDAVATFMPKPIIDEPGNGFHFHLSLFKGGDYMFSPGELNESAKGFVGGLLDHARALSAVCCPTINSYKRLVPGYEAPVYISWGGENRSVLVRIPAYGNKKQKKGRIEFRSSDASGNIYLMLNSLIVAGMDGMKRNLDPGPETTEDLFSLDEEEINDMGIEKLPSDLKEALVCLSKDKVVQSSLGDSYPHYMRLKKEEVKEYSREITPWEIDHYLEY